MSNNPKTFIIGSKPAQSRQKNHQVRIGHPQESEIVALLEKIAAGSENVVDLAEEAKALLLNDGIYASFSTMQFRGGQISDEPLRDFGDGLPTILKDQFLLYGRKPGTADEGEAQVLYRSWDSGRAKRGFTKLFMEFAVADYREAIGMTTSAASPAIGGAAAPAGAPGASQVKLR